MAFVFSYSNAACHELCRQAQWHVDDGSPPSDWPASGAITFDKYSTRYRPGLDLVLQDIDLDVKAGEKVKLFIVTRAV